MPKNFTDEEFAASWRRSNGSPVTVARDLGTSERNVYRRRNRLAEKGIQLETEAINPQWQFSGWTFERECRLEIDTGSVVVFSDAHYWPGEPSLAHQALLKVIRDTKPRAVIANGDIFDGGKVGRHPPFGWSHRPSATDEIHAAQERLGEIEQAVPKGCIQHWNVGNHCVRFERNLATAAPDYAGLNGFRLADHFPGWDFAWSLLVNGDVMIKHRVAGGIHAAYNNTLKGGLSIVTGHTHILEVKPWVDYRGRRWGVQTGTLADHHGPQFEYTENSPSPACSGFAVLTFRDGMLTPPELCEVFGGRAWFRGEVVAE